MRYDILAPIRFKWAIRANFKQRLKALENKVANDDIILTDAQVQAVEGVNQNRTRDTN